MPFVVPNLPFAFGSRSGTTAVGGSLNPIQSGSVSRIGATIAAYSPAGAIATTTSWGFMAGQAPKRRTSLVVAASGTTFERGATLAYGGYGSAAAEISITVEEFVNGALTRSVTSGPTPIIHIWSAVLGIQVHQRDATAATVLVMPIRPGRLYRWWINAVQSALCQGVTGPSYAISNFRFDMGPVFFAFT